MRRSASRAAWTSRGLFEVAFAGIIWLLVSVPAPHWCALQLHKTTQLPTLQEKSEEKNRIVKRLDDLRIALQCTWADVGEAIGLSESMIYQVKSGVRKLSPKAEHRLAAVERKAGIIPGNDLNLEHATSGAAKAFTAFLHAPPLEQLHIAEKEPSLWLYWLQMNISALELSFMNSNKKSAELARLTRAVSKRPANKDLRIKMLSLAKEILLREPEIDSYIAEGFDGIRKGVGKILKL